MNIDIYSKISQLYAELADSIDKSCSTVRDIFTEDGVLLAGNQLIEGVDAIEDYVSSMSLIRTRHIIVNICLGHGNNYEQNATARCITFVENESGSSIISSDYKSIFKHTASGWRFQRQEVTPAIRVAGAVS